MDRALLAQVRRELEAEIERLRAKFGGGIEALELIQKMERENLRLSLKDLREKLTKFQKVASIEELTEVDDFRAVFRAARILADWPICFKVLNTWERQGGRTDPNFFVCVSTLDFPAGMKRFFYESIVELARGMGNDELRALYQSKILDLTVSNYQRDALEKQFYTVCLPRGQMQRGGDGCSGCWPLIGIGVLVLLWMNGCPGPGRARTSQPPAAPAQQQQSLVAQPPPPVELGGPSREQSPVSSSLSNSAAADSSDLTQPESMLRRYYGLINGDLLRDAYALRSRRSRGTTSYNTFFDIWSNNRSVQLVEASVVARKPSRVQIRLRLIADDFNRRTGHYKVTTYLGLVKLVLEDGAWRYDGGDFQAESSTTTTGRLVAARSRGWLVVAGSFRLEQNAAREAERVRQAGYGTTVRRSDTCPGLRPGYYIVAVGPYPDRSRAQSVVSSLAGLGRGFSARIAPI